MLISNIENTVYTSPNSRNTFCYTPSIIATKTGRLIVSFDLGGDGAVHLDGEKSSRANNKKFGQGKIYISDDNGHNWSFVQNFPFWHARLFIVEDIIYLIGHAGDVCIMKSENNGDTWSDTFYLTTGEKWHSSACNVVISKGNVYLAMERRCYLNEIEGWDVAGLSPILFRANIKNDLCLLSSWDKSEILTFKDILEQIETDYFGIPFYPCNRKGPQIIGEGITNAPLGWLETNVVQINEKNHIWYDPNGNTFHLLLRAHTAGVGYACLLKVKELSNGKMLPSIENVVSEKKILFLPIPGGHLKFFIIYDDISQLFWLISNQATDSMRAIDSLDTTKRYGLPNNERHRLQLHFSKNCVDWCFAGMIACSNNETLSRNYPSAVIAGNDMHIVCRSANEDSLNSQYSNLITHHIVENFRQLIY